MESDSTQQKTPYGLIPKQRECSDRCSSMVFKQSKKTDNRPTTTASVQVSDSTNCIHTLADPPAAMTASRWRYQAACLLGTYRYMPIITQQLDQRDGYSQEQRKEEGSPTPFSKTFQQERKATKTL